ncbi:hypothetical protein DL98DRAFT_533414 [Cadophora sp. DSE1049]|nr:hypothetical protein DL98DRAFT_533414 [Cadophora sp. DSE1049]
MVFERVVGQFGHLSVALLTAVRATWRDFYGEEMKWWQVIGPSVLYHGLSDFLVLGASALESNVGFIHPTDVKMVLSMLGVVSGVWTLAVRQMWKEWTGLDERDATAANSRGQKGSNKEL